MKKFLFILSLVLICSNAISQQRDINSLFNQTLRNRGLTREDITIPVEFFSTAEKNPTNDVKLILPLVKDMMTNPLRSMTWLDSLSEIDKNTSINLINYRLWNFLDVGNSKDGINTIEEYFIYPDNIRGSETIENRKKPNSYKDLSKSIKKYLSFRKNNNTLNKIFDRNDLDYLKKHLFSILEDSENEDNAVFDILKYNLERDSSIQYSKTAINILSKIHVSDLYYQSSGNLRFCNDIMRFVTEFNNKEESLTRINNKNIQGDFYYYSDEEGIRIAIGGPGKNIYTGVFDFIIDLGGDDVYNIDGHSPLNAPHSKGGFSSGSISCIIDIAGNDYYSSSSDFALAGGLFSSSFIFDKAGDDYYESNGMGNLGASIGGLGLLYDEKGNDTYKGLSFSIGAGCFGVGLLVDREGNDFYIANSYSQGFGMTEGVGCIIDNKGNDSYLVDSRSLDIGRYNDHYVSMCQGYGLGLRPFYAGGIGLIIEDEGNDIYNTDIFGQGGAYWYSLGAIVDKSGHDKYNGYQYSQGSGIHLAVGLLKDYDGWDFYQSNGVSQGCGHDFGFGMLWDVKGNDNYSAYSLSQGAGNADGIGILIDESGTDGYLNKFPGNTRGYGNPRREYGSIGIFIDASGSDYYSLPGNDSTFINSTTWGVFTDYDYKDLPEQVSGDNFKVLVDSTGVTDTTGRKGRNFTNGKYSTEEYFMMAKTIEPRFSLWQEYGFKKLIDDSSNTARYILTKFNTTDHRDVQVFRVLSQKIQWSIAQVLLERLRAYTLGQELITQAELSMICYIFGETKDPSAKDYLLQLTYDNNYRIRSSAINALGKINYNKSDKDFIEKVINRLGELASEKSEKKIYNKDIAFALGNYISAEGIEILFKMLSNNYYGARFVAAENLKKYSELTNFLLENNSLPEFFNEETSFISFITAISSLNSNDFKLVYTLLSSSPVFNNDAVIYNLIKLLKDKINTDSDIGADNWYKTELNKLQAKVPLKVN